MNTQNISKIGALLQGQFEANGRRYTDAVRDLFEGALEPLGDDCATQCLLPLVLASEAPPKVATLLGAAAEFESPTPDEYFAWSEAQREVAKVHPRYSHKLIRLTVQDLGGDMAILTQLREEESAHRTLLAQFRDAYRAKRAHWQRLVVAEIQRPRDQWNLELFPVPAGYDYDQAVLSSPPRQAALPPARPQRQIEGVPPPPGMIEKLRGLGLGKMVDNWKHLHQDGPRMHAEPLDPDRLSEVREELRNRRHRLESERDDA